MYGVLKKIKYWFYRDCYREASGYHKGRTKKSEVVIRYLRIKMNQNKQKTMLTGKNKIQFHKFRVENYPHTELEIRGSGCEVWDYLSEAEKYGVYVDYFDSAGVEIEIYRDYDFADEIDIDYVVSIIKNKWFETRNEARIKAIEKANEIINNK